MMRRSRSVSPDDIYDATARDHHGLRLLPDAFRVDVHPERDVVRVCPRGEIDLDTVGAVRTQLDELTNAGFRRVVLDLRDATFLDSTGLRLAMDAQAASAADGWEFGIIAGPCNVQRAFEIAGLSERLPFVDPAALPRLRRTDAA
jgi:anti-sigma B factor antagonist